MLLLGAVQKLAAHERREASCRAEVALIRSAGKPHLLEKATVLQKMTTFADQETLRGRADR